jgi:hypothetical protein
MLLVRLLADAAAGQRLERVSLGDSRLIDATVEHPSLSTSLLLRKIKQLFCHLGDLGV